MNNDTSGPILKQDNPCWLITITPVGSRVAMVSIHNFCMYKYIAV